MRDNGFYGIGIECAKTNLNYGTLFRTAQIFDADFLFIIGRRFKKMPSDAEKSFKHIPVYEYNNFNDFNEHRPYNCPLIGIEITDKAIPIKNFIHPKQAIYLLGAEDHGLTEKAIEKCQSIIVLPGKICLNVAVAGSIVLYDRINKNHDNHHSGSIKSDLSFSSI